MTKGAATIYDISKNRDKPEPFRELKKNNNEFMDEIIGTKTSIGKQVVISD